MIEKEHAMTEDSKLDPRAGRFQIHLKEILIWIAGLSVILAIARLVGAVGMVEVGLLAIVFVSISLSGLMPQRLYVWALVGLALAFPSILATDLPSSEIVFAILLGVYGLAGAPIAISWARGRGTRGLVLAALVSAAIAFTPADPISMLIAYFPLQLGLLGYAVFIPRPSSRESGD
jgi:hypothetical protein